MPQDGGSVLAQLYQAQAEINASKAKTSGYIAGSEIICILTGTRAGLSGKTVKNTSAIMHKAFSVALKQGIIAANPCDAAELPKVEHKEIRPLADDEIPLFLFAIEGSPMRNAYALCLFAGLREGECLGLSWGQVDFEKGGITVRQQLQKVRTNGKGEYLCPPPNPASPEPLSRRPSP